MGNGIGKDCKRCGEQLDHEKGFNDDETLCKRCETVVTFDVLPPKEKKKLIYPKDTS